MHGARHFCKHAPYLYVYVKNELFLCLLYADNNDVEDVSRTYMVLPIRNFYRYVDYGKERETREIKLHSQRITKREIFICQTVYRNLLRNVEKYDRANERVFASF